MEQFHGTTILCVRRGAEVALGGDGQVTLGNIVMKGTARKVRKVYGGKVLVGFAGGTADAFTLLDRFEGKLDKHQGDLRDRVRQTVTFSAPTGKPRKISCIRQILGYSIIQDDIEKLQAQLVARFRALGDACRCSDICRHDAGVVTVVARVLPP